MLLTIVIQAGGDSQRMGVDKGLLPFLGQPLVARVIARLTPIADEMLITASNPEAYASFGIPVVHDLIPGRGALGGLYTALSAASHSLVGIVACDMPWLNRSLISYMISLRETADVIVPLWHKFPEPFHAVYNKSCLPPIEASLKARKLKMIAFFDEVAVRYLYRETVTRFDSEGRSFANINTPEDLEDMDPGDNRDQ